jgi:hypothetical protein
MKRPTVAEINARNRKRATYRARVVERLFGAGGPIEVTPEIERALKTPVNKLPVDQVLLGALRRAGTVDLAHPEVRLAKMRQKKRNATRLKNAARTRGASDKQRGRGERSRAAVAAEFAQLSQRDPHITRKEAAKQISPRVHLSVPRVLKLLPLKTK